MQSAVTSGTYVRRNEKSTVYVTDLLIGVIVILVTFRGFIDNFIGYGTLLVDACFAVLLIWELYACLTGMVKRSRYAKVLRLYLAWVILCLAVGFFQVVTGKTSLYDAAIGFRNNNVYTGLFLIAALRLNRESIRRFYRMFVNCGVFICAFAIVQYVFRGILPDSLLVLDGEDIFTLHGSDVIRVTGLMGNTIIFGGFAIVLFSLVWAELIAKKYRPFLLWVKLAVIALANYFTISRASVVGMAAVFVLEFVLYGCTHRRAIESIVITVIFLFLALLVVFTLFGDSVIIQRLLGQNSDWTAGSDAGHFNMIDLAVEAIGQNWLIGTLMGQSNSVVTDGTFWAYLLEMGVPVFLVYCILLFSLLLIALRNCKSKDKMTCGLSIAYIGMNAYLLVFSFINSAYAARSVLVFVWLIGGMMLAITARKPRTAASAAEKDCSSHSDVLPAQKCESRSERTHAPEENACGRQSGQIARKTAGEEKSDCGRQSELAADRAGERERAETRACPADRDKGDRT